MKRIKQQLQVVGEKLTNLDVKTKRLLIAGAVLAVAIPAITIASFASNPSGTTKLTNLSSAYRCSNITRLEAAKEKNCAAYEAAKAGKVKFDYKLEEAKAAYETHKQQGCANLSGQDLTQCNQELTNLKQAFDAAGTMAIKAMLEVTRTKNVCENSTATLSELKERCSVASPTPSPAPTPDQNQAPTPGQDQTPGQTDTVDNDIQVCNLQTKQVVTIKESEFNTAKHSKNLNLCLTAGTTPTVREIRVCDLVQKKIVTIKESDFDAAKHTKNIDSCVSPAGQLPQTGPAETLVSLLAVTVLTAAGGYLISTRKPKTNQNNEIK